MNQTSPPKVLGVIPARYASTRFPGKPLFPIAGRPLLEWVVRGARQSKMMNDLIVATDHLEIANLAKKLGVKVILTDSHLPSGSDRVWAAVSQLKEEYGDEDYIVNIQGDEPLIKGELVDQLILGILKSHSEIATLIKEIEPEDLAKPNVVKAIINQKGEALYFSRLPIPYTRMKPEGKILACWQHLGLYVYKKSFLKTFCATSPCLIEQAESLEQLRALWLGAKIQTIRVDYQCMGVDTPEDVQKVEPFLVSL